MADKVWIGGATAVRKVMTLTASGTPAGETIRVHCGGKQIVSYTDATGSDLAEMMTNIANQWNSSTDPYASQVTAVAASGSVTWTADTAGVPFFIEVETDTSGGITYSLSTTTANGGPNSWGDGNNWLNATTGQMGTAPVSTDNVYLRNSADAILWDLDQSAVALSTLYIERSFTGRLGLPTDVFTTSSNGLTTSANVREYRQTYLKIGYTRAEVGAQVGPGAAAGSGRIKLHGTTNNAVTVLEETGSSPVDTNRPAFRFLCTGSGHKLYIRGARAGAGVGVDEPGESCTLHTLSVSADTNADRVFTGPGVYFTSLVEQDGGNNLIQSASTIPTVNCRGGTLVLQGQFVVTNLYAYGGTITPNNVTGGNCITNCHLEGGTVDMVQSSESRTIAALNPNEGSILLDTYVTVTAINEPNRKRTVSVA